MTLAQNDLIVYVKNYRQTLQEKRSSNEFPIMSSVVKIFLCSSAVPDGFRDRKETSYKLDKAIVCARKHKGGKKEEVKQKNKTITDLERH